MSAPRLTAQEVDDALAALPRARVAVCGDFCLDGYWMIDERVSERSVETGLPVRHVCTQRYSLGGAGNVVANLAALGVREILALGLTGDDVFGALLRNLLQQAGADCSGVGVEPAEHWSTPVYIKPYLGDEELSRFDCGTLNVLTSAQCAALGSRIVEAARRCDTVVVNQQLLSGTVTPGMVECLNRAAAAAPRTLFLADTRHRAALFRGVALKINASEAGRLAGVSPIGGERFNCDEVQYMAHRLQRQLGPPVFITRGPDGMVVADADAVHVVPGVAVAGPVDPVGAGDTVTATLAAALSTGATPRVAAQLASLAASVTVRKLRTTGTATREEIRAAWSASA